MDSDVEFVIGVDLGRWCTTIEVLDRWETVLLCRRFPVVERGYERLLAAGAQWSRRLWVVPVSLRRGLLFARRLESDGERVLVLEDVAVVAERGVAAAGLIPSAAEAAGLVGLRVGLAPVAGRVDGASVLREFPSDHRWS